MFVSIRLKELLNKQLSCWNAMSFTWLYCDEYMGWFSSYLDALFSKQRVMEIASFSFWRLSCYLKSIQKARPLCTLWITYTWMCIAVLDFDNMLVMHMIHHILFILSVPLLPYIDKLIMQKLSTKKSPNHPNGLNLHIPLICYRCIQQMGCISRMGVFYSIHTRK